MPHTGYLVVVTVFDAANMEWNREMRTHTMAGQKREAPGEAVGIEDCIN